jgi:hypothetical protein
LPGAPARRSSLYAPGVQATAEIALPSDVAARSRSRVAGWPLTLIAGLIGALPVIVSLARALSDLWMPAGDQGIIATRAYDVFSSHSPLVGQYSLVSEVIGHLTYSPGPMLYWLIALPARFGSPGTIALAMGIANTLCVLAIVALARRRGGVALMLLVAVAVAVMCRSFMAEALHDPWNPSAGLLPFALLVFLCWSLACGERRLLPAVALVGSFTAQCQVTFLAPTLGLVAVGLIGLLVARRRPRRDRPLERSDPDTREMPALTSGASAARGARGSRDRSGRLWPWTLAALAVLVLCWAPPVIDEIQHSPGNLTLLYRAATRHSKTMGTSAGTRAVVRAVGIPPRWLRTPGDPYDTRLSDVTSAPGTRQTLSCIAILAALLAAGVAGAWRRRVDLASAAAIGLLLCLAFAAVAASTPVGSAKVLGYTLWWGSVAGMFVWVALGFCGVELAREAISARRIRPLLGRPTLVVGATASALCAAALIAGSVAFAQPRDAHRSEYGPIASIESQLERAKLPHDVSVNLRSSLGGVAAPLSQAIKFLLRRERLRILQYGAIARLGPWYELDHHPYNYVVYAYDSRTPPDPHARVIARTTMREPKGSTPSGPGLGGVRTVTVSIAPAQRAPAALGPRRAASVGPRQAVSRRT